MAKKAPVKDFKQQGRYFLSVDPGINGTGLAFWDWETRHNLTAPLRVELCQAQRSGESYHARCLDLYQQLYSVCCLNGYGLGYEDSGLMQIVIEIPKVYNRAGGMKAAASGAVDKLSYLAGMISSLGLWAHCEVTPVYPSDWKGQLSKSQTERRVARKLVRYKRTPAMRKLHNLGNDNLWDAVALGLWAKGFFE